MFAQEGGGGLELMTYASLGVVPAYWVTSWELIYVIFNLSFEVSI